MQTGKWEKQFSFIVLFFFLTSLPWKAYSRGRSLFSLPNYCEADLRCGELETSDSRGVRSESLDVMFG